MDTARTWLLQHDDPAIRAGALVSLEGRDPTDRPVVEAKRASLETGSVARVLAGLQVGADMAALYVPKYVATYHRLIALADMGAPSGVPKVDAALRACLDLLARDDGGFGRSGGHLCVTGNLTRAAILLGHGADPRVERALEWLLAQQNADGGWNCWPEADGASQLDAWQPLAAFGAIPENRRSPEVGAALERGLERFLGADLGAADDYEAWRRIHFPRHYYYDLLVGLDVVTSLGVRDDERLEPAMDWLRSKRRADGRWGLDAQHPDITRGTDYAPHHPGMTAAVPLVVDEVGGASAWATLVATRVLKRTEE